MPVEIERKFLVIGNSWRSLGTATVYRQGYLAIEKHCTVRVRTAEEKAYITIKGSLEGISRREYEYEIPLQDAEELLESLCDRPLIEKTRHRIQSGELLWEVDEFWGDNEGLIMAEVELPDPQYPVELPEWIGQEVSNDPRYYNSSLSKNPFRNWGTPSTP